MARKYKADIFDIVGEEAARRLGELGYELLSKNGYDTEGAMDSHDRARELKRLMRSRGQTLRYRTVADTDGMAVIFWYELYSGAYRVAKSPAVRLVPKMKS